MPAGTRLVSATRGAQRSSPGAARSPRAGRPRGRAQPVDRDARADQVEVRPPAAVSVAAELARWRSSGRSPARLGEGQRLLEDGQLGARWSGGRARRRRRSATRRPTTSIAVARLRLGRRGDQVGPVAAASRRRAAEPGVDLEVDAAPVDADRSAACATTCSSSAHVATPTGRRDGRRASRRSSPGVEQPARARARRCRPRAARAASDGNATPSQSAPAGERRRAPTAARRGRSRRP